MFISATNRNSFKSNERIDTFFIINVAEIVWLESFFKEDYK